MGLFEAKKEAWVAEYQGHKIEVINSAKVALFIDGKEVAKQKDIFVMSCMLRAD